VRERRGGVAAQKCECVSHSKWIIGNFGDRDRYTPIMNSLGASGSCRSKHGSGSGSSKQGDKDKEVYSGAGELSGSEDASKEATKLKKQDKGKKASRLSQAKEAFEAMGRVREPFIAEVSLIAAANDTTLVQGANSDSDVELVMEGFRRREQQYVTERSNIA